jgi:hypothetical protein
MFLRRRRPAPPVVHTMTYVMTVGHFRKAFTRPAPNRHVATVVYFRTSFTPPR